MNTTKPRKLVRLGNAAERLDLQQSTLRAWFLARKHLVWVKCGRAVCCTEESLEAFIDRNLVPAAPSHGTRAAVAGEDTLCPKPTR